MSFFPVANPTIRFGVRKRSSPFSPAQLFSAGEIGVWYDPGDLSTVWQDAARTIPGEVGQPVGCIDDKSGNGKHAVQATGASRPVLRQDGATGAFYLEFSNHFLATAAINFGGSDALSMFAGLRKGSDAGSAIPLELSAITDDNNGSFGLLVPGDGGGSKYKLTVRGTVHVAAGTTSAAYNAPHKGVVSALMDISEDKGLLRVNGTQVAAIASDMGSGNFGNHALYIGKRNGAALPFTGDIYGICCVGRSVDAGDIAAIESWINGRVGAW